MPLDAPFSRGIQIFAKTSSILPASTVPTLWHGLCYVRARVSDQPPTADPHTALWGPAGYGIPEPSNGYGPVPGANVTFCHGPKKKAENAWRSGNHRCILLVSGRTKDLPADSGLPGLAGQYLEPYPLRVKALGAPYGAPRKVTATD